MKNLVSINDVFDTQQLEKSFKISNNYKKYGTSDRVNKTNCTPKPLRTKDIISEVKMMNGFIQLGVLQEIPTKATENPIKQQTERCVQITNNQRECTFEQKEFILETKGKYHHLLKKATRRNRKLK